MDERFSCTVCPARDTCNGGDEECRAAYAEWMQGIECNTDECPDYQGGTCNHNSSGSTCDGPSII